MTREATLAQLDVSRETTAKLDIYATLLSRWNRAINLVAPNTLPDLWRRHFLDSAQVLAYGPDKGIWLDIGTGGGFPGLICALLAHETRPQLNFQFIESDQRKCTFLATVIRETGINGRIHAERVESLPPVGASVVSARALAPLAILIEYAERHLTPGGTGLFLKGTKHDQEIATALETWSFDVQKHTSETDPYGALLTVGNIARV
ncbi:16S rRNA (guanine(527)-N(7))-methyltransferase RsmG [Vannielia litorea]|uniref:16S rRNA (guanine(527)-N(7))-methyltransferase RsmG n=1 Tax=Vannielia litorea TaxID=1217970 RepID=UPI001C98153A|nr:16S rRNA (guanine(527)-N(7))-methyltransferase RsmG [Vannielia litorea]MBY6049301.1 16S rRNA (guanine(527)-N(7))-methyltransferase RsmG [Vannielia litorea]MBY6076715.1 16S rRNA (guanine(527)-N(7))-methyltransferase RsmG [Vannielia litorea]